MNTAPSNKFALALAHHEMGGRGLLCEPRPVKPSWSKEDHTVRHYFEALIRHKGLILAAMTMTVLATLFVSLLQPKEYQAKTTIEVTPRSQKITKFEDMATDVDVNSREYYDTQVELIQKAVLLRRVIDKLDLENHPFIRQSVLGKPSEPTPSMLTRVRALLGRYLPALRPDESRSSPPPMVDPALVREEAIMGYLRRQLEFGSSRSSLLIDIAFTSADRTLTYEVPNSLAAAFVELHMDKKRDASQHAQTFLSQKIADAKKRLEAVETALAAYARDNGIVSLDSNMNSTYRQLEGLNTALAEAEADYIAKEALYRQAIENGPASLPEVMESKVIGDLKTEYAALQAAYQKARVRFMDGYPSVQELLRQMEGIAQQINLEEALILNTVKHRYEAAGKRLAEIEERLTRQTDLSMALNEKASQYQILERDVETHQQIYNSLLERSREIESMAGVAPTNVQIVAPATPPVFPSRPNLTLNLALALLFGLTGGIGLAFLKEYLSRRIHHPTEIAHRFQIPILGLIPAARPGRQNLDTAIRDTPSSPFTEAMLAVRVSLGAATAYHRQTSLLITSSLPGEGKTTLTANMALAFAGAGEKTLLIDADLRKPRLQHVFGKRTSMGRPGLADYLRGAGSEGLIQSNGRANLHFIAAGAIPPNPSALLTSHRMRSLLKTLGPKYDRILIDSPPLLGFADVMVLSQYVDGVVLVSWPEATTRDELRLFKQTMAGVNARVTGCIINKVNLAGRLGRYPNPYGENAYYRGTS